MPVLGAWMFNSIYKFPAYQFNCQTVLTNKTWVDAYRGAGRPEATFAIERIMDELAAEVGVDPLEIREKNWITHDEFPFTTVAGHDLRLGQLRGGDRQGQASSSATTSCGPSRSAAARATTRCSSASASRPSPRCAAWPPRGCSASLSYGAGGWEHASIRMLATGKVEVITGTSPHGQGHETAWSQIVADRLGVPFEDVEVLHGDTQIAPKGLDTYGSRSLVVGGEALVLAADKVIEKAKAVRGAPARGRASTTSSSPAAASASRAPTRASAIAEIALATLRRRTTCPTASEPSIDADATYDPVNFSFPHGTHLCAMEVDTETGATTMRKYVCVDDIGTIINPLIVEGQVHGGLVQGIAQALWEGAEYDDQGTLVTGSFVDYTLPTAADTISFVTDHTTSPSTTNTLGHQGRRRGRHHRLHPGGRQRHRGCRASPRRRRRPDAVHARTGVEGHPGRPARHSGDVTGEAAAALRGRLPQPGPLEPARRTEQAQ